MDRRKFLAASVAAASAVVTNAAGGATEGPFGETAVPLPVAPGGQLPLGPLSDTRYPDRHIESLDKRFKGSVGTGAVERIATGFRWAEGPAYFAAGRYLIFSDIPNNRLMRLLEDDNHLSVFRYPALNCNGNTVDREGRLISCEHSGRRVVRTEHDGTITVIADAYNGKKLNSPNDAVVASDGSIWFTDPTYGVRGWYEGLHGDIEQTSHNVYRVDRNTGAIKVVIDDFVQPNGILFSPDEKKLYVVDTGISEGPQNPSHIRSFDVDVGGTVRNGKVFAKYETGLCDGIRCDVEGNVWAAGGWGDPKEDGVRSFAPDGTLLGKIHLPETAGNLTFGGVLRNRLYILASTSVYACYVNTQGALRP
ncbi:MAG: SMP-30/gluconolactonase/LRE family protein [Burkholderiales bacterium]|nr:SMP-30/gluconolactonase/LRE family protein [Burkholderiales bacterium]